MSNNHLQAVRDAERLGELVHDNEHFRHWLIRRDNLLMPSYAELVAHIAKTYIKTGRCADVLNDWAQGR